MMVKNENGSGMAIYILTVFLIMTLISAMTVFVIIQLADANKERTKVLLRHALDDAARMTYIIPTYDSGGRYINNLVYLPELPFRSFCTSVNDGISLPKLMHVQEPNGTSDCLNRDLVPEQGNKDYPNGMKILEFTVVNNKLDPNYSRLQTVNGIATSPPFIYAKIEVPRYYIIGQTKYLSRLIVEDFRQPALFDAINQKFVNKSCGNVASSQCSKN